MRTAILVVLSGWITFANAGVLERVAAYHGLECAECVGVVGVADCAYHGKVVYLEVEGQYLGPVLSVDCGQAEHRSRQRERQLVADLSYALWQDLDLPRKPVRGALISQAEFQRHKWLSNKLEEVEAW